MEFKKKLSILINLMSFGKDSNIKSCSIDEKQVVRAFNSQHLPVSVIFFTTHKCASSFMGKFFNSIADSSDYQVVNYASAIWQLGDKLDIGSPYELFLEKCYDSLYMKRGYIYTPQRRPLDFPGRNEYKNIFFLRDPRDVLVSAYYSFGFYHGPPKGANRKIKFYESRNETQEKGIDQYAIDASIEWILPLYENYIRLKEASQSSIYLSYDQFRDNPVSFINQILGYLDLPLGDDEIYRIAETTSVGKSEKRNHIRSGKSNQFIEELSDDTINIINKNLHNILLYWGFEK